MKIFFLLILIFSAVSKATVFGQEKLISSGPFQGQSPSGKIYCTTPTSSGYAGVAIIDDPEAQKISRQIIYADGRYRWVTFSLLDKNNQYLGGEELRRNQDIVGAAALLKMSLIDTAYIQVRARVFLDPEENLKIIEFVYNNDFHNMGSIMMKDGHYIRCDENAIYREIIR